MFIIKVKFENYEMSTNEMKGFVWSVWNFGNEQSDLNLNTKKILLSPLIGLMVWYSIVP